jgi:hypothetical protein
LFLKGYYANSELALNSFSFDSDDNTSINLTGNKKFNSTDFDLKFKLRTNNALSLKDIFSDFLDDLKNLPEKYLTSCKDFSGNISKKGHSLNLTKITYNENAENISGQIELTPDNFLLDISANNFDFDKYFEAKFLVIPNVSEVNFLKRFLASLGVFKNTQAKIAIDAKDFVAGGRNYHNMNLDVAIQNNKISITDFAFDGNVSANVTPKIIFSGIINKLSTTPSFENFKSIIVDNNFDTNRYLYINFPFYTNLIDNLKPLSITTTLNGDLSQLTAEMVYDYKEYNSNKLDNSAKATSKGVFNLDQKQKDYDSENEIKLSDLKSFMEMISTKKSTRFLDIPAIPLSLKMRSTDTQFPLYSSKTDISELVVGSNILKGSAEITDDKITANLNATEFKVENLKAMLSQFFENWRTHKFAINFETPKLFYEDIYFTNVKINLDSEKEERLKFSSDKLDFTLSFKDRRYFLNINKIKKLHLKKQLFNLANFDIYDTDISGTMQITFSKINDDLTLSSDTGYTFDFVFENGITSAFSLAYIRKTLLETINKSNGLIKQSVFNEIINQGARSNPLATPFDFIKVKGSYLNKQLKLDNNTLGEFSDNNGQGFGEFKLDYNTQGLKFMGKFTLPNININEDQTLCINTTISNGNTQYSLARNLICNSSIDRIYQTLLPSFKKIVTAIRSKELEINELSSSNKPSSTSDIDAAITLPADKDNSDKKDSSYSPETENAEENNVAESESVANTEDSSDDSDEDLSAGNETSISEGEDATDLSANPPTQDDTSSSSENTVEENKPSKSISVSKNKSLFDELDNYVKRKNSN